MPTMELRGRISRYRAPRSPRAATLTISRGCRHRDHHPAPSIPSARQHSGLLPGDIDAEKVDAALYDGVLTARLPKAAASHPRQIEIKED
jgi:hypothetical protein